MNLNRYYLFFIDDFKHLDIPLMKSLLKQIPTESSI